LYDYKPRSCGIVVGAVVPHDAKYNASLSISLCAQHI